MKSIRNCFSLLAVLVLGGCASSQPTDERELLLAETVALKLAENGGSDRSHLNVSIRAFDSDENISGSVYLAAVQVRSVEQRYLPFVLKGTLDRSGFWGAVRVMPRDDPNAEIMVEGRILASDGVELEVHIRVSDVTGRVWLNQIYHDVTDDLDYSSDPTYVTDPFQDLYNRIANDMGQALIQLEDSQHSEILNVAMMRYGQMLAENVFTRYLNTDGERYSLAGLPAGDDPLLLGVQRIRESEYLFADSVDAHYESLYRTIGPTYAWWRYYSYELIVGNERLGQKDATRGATRGSWYAMERIYKTFKEAKMNQDALRELTESFDRETASSTAEIAGRVVELNGSIDAQYRTWRRILAEMYRSEMGF